MKTECQVWTSTKYVAFAKKLFVAELVNNVLIFVMAVDVSDFGDGGAASLRRQFLSSLSSLLLVGRSVVRVVVLFLSIPQ